MIKNINEKKIAAFISIISNVTLTLLKFIVGYVSGSISIISEVLHSLSDLLASLIAFFAINKSSRPPDSRYEFGYNKYEDLSGLIEGLLIILASIYIVYESVNKIFFTQNNSFNSSYGIIVMLIAIIVNILVSKYLFIVAKRNNSIALFADAEHLRTDIYTSVSVMLALVAIKFTNIYIIDPIIAIIVSLLIFKAGYKICQKTIKNLLDESLPIEEKEKIIKIVEKYISKDVVNHICKLRTREAGGKKEIEIIICMNENLTIKQGHIICDKIESDIKSAIGNSEVIIHMEPICKMCLNKNKKNLINTKQIKY